MNQKGGSGKSTLAECLAVAAYLDDKATAILDMDPQGTVYAWSKRREDPDPVVRSVQIANLEDEWRRLRDAGAEIVFIDTPARLSDWAMKAAELADLVIVPSKPTIKDLERVAASIKLANSESLTPCLVVLNQVRPQSERWQDAEAFIRAKSYPVCSARFGYRVAYEDSDTLGKTPLETEPSGRAAEEIRMVYQHTITLLHQITGEKAGRYDTAQEKTA
ncbi:MAG: ParA family protein [Pseudomonadota bacterium]